MSGALLSELWPWLALLLAAWPLLHALGFGLAAWQVMRLRLRPVSWVPAQRAQRPAAEQALLHEAASALAGLGFGFQGGLSGLPVVQRLPDVPQYTELYRASDGRSWALLSLNAQPEATCLYTVQWLSCLENGHNWLSVSSSGQQDVLPLPGHWHIGYTPPTDWRAAWQAHMQRLAQAPAPAMTDAAEVIRRYNALLQELAPHLAERGMATPAGPGLWRLRVAPALRLTWQLLRKQRNARTVASAAAAASADAAHAPGGPAGSSPPQAPAGLRLQADMLAFAQQQALLAAMRQQRRPWRTFFFSAVLFWLLGAWWLSWQTASLVLLVIAVHEGGHWLLMRWCGFAHLSVFFIPGLGAAATGEKAHAAPLEKVLVYLAGPMPGLVLALAAAAALAGPEPWPGWLRELLLISLAINCFNLLPLVPLDGGRVLDTLLFARLPALRLVFALCGLGALGTLAWWLRDPVITLVTGLLALSLPWQWRAMQLERTVRRAMPASTLDEASATRQLFAALQQPVFARWSFAQRVAAVRALLPSLQGRAPRWGETAAGLLLYAACLGLPLAAAHWAPQAWAQLWHGPQASAETLSQQRERLHAELARAPQLPPDERASLYLHAAQTLLDWGDEDSSAHEEDTESGATPDTEPPTQARSLYTQAWDLLQARPADDTERATALLGLADTAPSAAERQRWLLRLLHDAGALPQPPDAVRQLLATALQSLAADAPDTTPAAQRLRWLQQAAAHLRHAGPPDNWQLIAVREHLARALDGAGYPDAALAQLRANVAALHASVQSPAQHDESLWKLNQLSQAETELAWFHIAHGQPQTGWELGHSAWARLQAAQARSGDDSEQPLYDYASFTRAQAAQAQLWAALTLGDAARIRSAWPHQDHRDTPLHAVDELAAATAAGDAQWQAQALARLRPPSARQQPLPPHVRHALCQARPAPRPGALHAPSWREPAQAQRTRIARTQGLCQAAVDSPLGGACTLRKAPDEKCH